ncbi:hypothetical protein [Lentilactobacillus kribbianus]|uniref:hypothetical protein n=1 Tax=Lentilactobacillus kribbianus TaxID=2729622 RepID=UPI001557B5D8|nr:hypothetical protein [Lentilactobacillus kribbianus]
MSAANNSVKIALITMYLIGILCLAITFFILKRVNGRPWTRFSTGLMTIIMLMAVILTISFNLE